MASGESAHLPTVRPGFDSGRYHIWVEFVIGSHLAQQGFSAGTQFSSSPKTSISKFRFGQDRGPTLKSARGDGASSLNIFSYIYLFTITKVIWYALVKQSVL